MKRVLWVIIAIHLFVVSYGQRETITLRFTANNNSSWLQLDRIKVINQSQGGDTMLYYPDTILVLEFEVGLDEDIINASGFRLYPNYPNPATDETNISLYCPESGPVNMIFTDITGRMIFKTDMKLERGTHTFRLAPGNNNIILFTAQWKETTFGLKIINSAGGVSRNFSFDYLGKGQVESGLKSEESSRGFPFTPEDNLLFIGYNNSDASGFMDKPQEDTLYTFQYATNIPCPGTPEVDYEGQIYNTVQVYNQCWLKENLNVGTMIPGADNMTDNGIIEKYCYYDILDSCGVYGGLYQWQELMQYDAQEGRQGICPPGWHVPTDEEWKILEGAVDSQYKFGDPEWEIYEDERGFDAGTNLKTTSGWYEDGFGTDLFGFFGRPAGFIDDMWKEFYLSDRYADWWTSTKHSDGDNWVVHLSHNWSGVGRFNYNDMWGFHVRCIRDQ